jgi:hypothetical protein
VDTTVHQSHLLGGLLGGLTQTVGSLLVTPVHRATPLANDVTWTFQAGPYGGLTSNPQTGLTVYVPPGALDQNVTITVTALKGSAVAYRFEPHLEFDEKVVLTQNLNGLRYGLLGTGLLNLSSFKGAHFPGDAPVYTWSGQARVDEVVSALLSLFTKSVSFGVDHFTGWIVASGYSDNY